MTGKRGTPEERFWRYVHKTDTCWLWTGAIRADRGYGRFWDGAKREQAHRYSWKLAHGPIPAGYDIDHDHPQRGCGNPACVNPEHLDAVPRTVNARRRRKTGRVRGVSWHKRKQQYLVRVRHDYKLYHGGYFHTLEEAAEAAESLRQRLYGEKGE